MLSAGAALLAIVALVLVGSAVGWLAIMGAVRLSREGSSAAGDLPGGGAGTRPATEKTHQHSSPQSHCGQGGK